MPVDDQMLSIELERLLDDDRSDLDTEKEANVRRRRLNSASAKLHSFGRLWPPRCTTVLLMAIIFILSAVLAFEHRHDIPRSFRDLQKWSEALRTLGQGHLDSESDDRPQPGFSPRSCLCPRTWTGERLCGTYPPAALRRSRVHTGTNARLKSALRPFLAAEGDDSQLRIGIMGGSVSACHGASTNGDPMDIVCYPRIFKDWLEERIGDRSGDSIVVKNGAIGGMDSSYYAFCGMHHLPQDVDIVLLEFDVNDQPSNDYILYFDQLVRILLSLPSNPAVIVFGSWGPLISHNLGSLSPLVPHLPIAYYYDLPYISTKPLLFDTFLRYPHSVFETFSNADGYHPNIDGQRLLADVLISYFESVLCELDMPSDEEGWTDRETWIGGGPYTIDHSEGGFQSLVSQKAFLSSNPDTPSSNITAYDFLSLPNPTSFPPVPFPVPMSIYFDYTKPDPATFLGVNDTNHMYLPPVPYCADANDPANPLKPKEGEGENASEGWTTMVWKGEKHFWVSDKPGARLVVDIKVNEGRVAVFYFRSENLSPGMADCWVDDNREGAIRLEGHWGQKSNIPSVAYIDRGVTPGNHYVTCEISSDSHDPTSPTPHHFRIVAIMAT